MMLPEVGLFALILALLFSILLILIPSLGLIKNKNTWIEAANTYTWAQFGFIALAFGCLAISFLHNDFTVAYIVSNSSLLLPWFYKLCAVWGGHEGSMLLWIFILSGWMGAVALSSRGFPARFRVKVLIVLGILSAGLILFLLTTSNPFGRAFQFSASTGQDLNPLLQDPGFLFHPPMLYMGYVGLAIPFAFAIAALWEGQLQKEWLRWVRPWALASWCFLTLGITLGSWWVHGHT